MSSQAKKKRLSNLGTLFAYYGPPEEKADENCVKNGIRNDESYAENSKMDDLGKDFKCYLFL